MKPPVRRLQLPDAEQVLDAVGIALAEAVHHGDRGLHSLLVGFFLHAEPLVGLGLLPGHPFADGVYQDLAAAARNRIEARLRAADGPPPPPACRKRSLKNTTSDWARTRGCESDGGCLM